MKKSKHRNYHKIVALVLIAIVLISAVGFVANGWQPIFNSEADSGDTENNENGNADKNNNGEGGTEGDIPVVADPKYYHYLTGLEVSEETSKRTPTTFIVNPSSLLYGVSSSPLSIEFPIENGQTRLLIYSDNATSLGKIGAIEASRGYISNMLKHFGGTLISLGSDDIIEYSKIDVTKAHIDLSAITGYHYTELKNAFTNGDLLKAALFASGVPTELSGVQRLPFVFADESEEKILLDNTATRIDVPLSSETQTELVFNLDKGRYEYFKDGAVKTDMLSTATIEYDNVFVLFADSVTYETCVGTELVMNTLGTGSGYYMTNGTYAPIKWVADGDTMTFYDENDNKLEINRGTSYIAFVKSTNSSKLNFS